MKPYLVLFLVGMLSLTSCHTASYTFDLQSDSYDLVFQKGDWLLYDADVPDLVSARVNEIARENFLEYLGTGLQYPEDLSGVILPVITDMDISEGTLKDLKNGSGFDFLIYIQGEKIRNDIGGVQVGSIKSYQKNEAIIALGVYDLNSLKRIYYQHVRGTLEVEDDSADFKFSRSAEGIIVDGFKKIIKKIKRNHSFSEGMN